MDITPLSHSNHVPADVIALAHVQARHVSIYVAINWRHLVTCNEFRITFLRLGYIRIVGQALNVVIQKPTLVFVYLRKENDKFFVHVFSL